MIEKDQLDSIHHESQCIIRDKVSPEIQFQQIENGFESKVTSDTLSTKFGVNGICCLTRLSYLEPTKFFFHDLMNMSNESILNRCAC
jgi:hypothetical protein